MVSDASLVTDRQEVRQRAPQGPSCNCRWEVLSQSPRCLHLSRLRLCPPLHVAQLSPNSGAV